MVITSIKWEMMMQRGCKIYKKNDGFPNIKKRME
jgi:hypothetical protein